VKSRKKKVNSETKELNVHIVRTKKFLFLIVIIIGGIFAMQIFQIGPWTFQPGVKWPYLSFFDDPRYNMGISCGSPQTCILTLQYGENSSLQESLTDSEATTLHEFELINLKPDTKYYWKLIASDASIQLDYLDILHDFRTASEPSLDKPFKFTLIGDTRPDLFGISGFSKLMSMMITEDPDFMMNVGDIVMGPGFSGQWDRFFYEIRQCADIGAPYMVGLGNHEWDEWNYFNPPDKGETYEYYMNYPHTESYYAFNFSNVAFISIDTNSGEMTDEQMSVVESWLDAANKSADIDWIIVFGHYPLYSAGGRSSYLNKFEELFIDYNVDMYLAGHIHHYSRAVVNGITYIVSGGGGAELDFHLDPPEFIQSCALTFQYCNIAIDNKSLSFECIAHNGLLIDQCTLEPRKG